VRESTGLYPRVRTDAAGAGVVSQAGAVLLLDTIRAAGLDGALSRALDPWRRPTAVHDPAKVLLDVAVSLAVGGDCLADIAVLRAAPAIFGCVASDPTVSRLISTLAGDADRASTAIEAARAAARREVWRRAGAAGPDHDADHRRPLIVDVDATLVTAHSEKEQAAPTFKRGFGHHPLTAFVDHGPAGTGEPVAMLLRRGNAGSNTAADHISVIRSALRQLPADNQQGHRAGRSVLVRIDGAGSTHELLDWLTARRLSYSVGFGLPENTADLLQRIPEGAWSPALDADGEVREGAWVTELTGLLNLARWPAGMRVIARVERPHPGAQLRITDHDGNRVTAFATNTRPGGPGAQLANLELRHRRRARCEDRIRAAKDTGLTNLPLHDFDANRIWCAVVQLACELIAWTQMLGFAAHPARRWEPKRLRLRLFTTAAGLARHARRLVAHLAAAHPWTALVLTGRAAITGVPARPG
jgi:Transposase DDE domain group 1